MFISNIIYKLPIIIYKSKIICKGYNNPYKQRPTVKLYSYKYQVSLNPIHCIAHPSSVSIVAPICIYFLIYPNSYSYLSIRFFVLQVIPPVLLTKAPSKVDV